MPVLFARAAIVPIWMIVVALIALLAPPGGPRLRDLLLILGIALVASALLALVGSAIRALAPRALIGDSSWTRSLHSTSNDERFLISVTESSRSPQM